jgi:hypothetical protein
MVSDSRTNIPVATATGIVNVEIQDNVLLPISHTRDIRGVRVLCEDPDKKREWFLWSPEKVVEETEEEVRTFDPSEYPAKDERLQERWGTKKNRKDPVLTSTSWDKDPPLEVKKAFYRAVTQEPDREDLEQFLLDQVAEESVNMSIALVLEMTVTRQDYLIKKRRE